MSRPRRVPRFPLAWIGALPYLAVVAVFLIAPVVVNVWSSLQVDGRFSFENLAKAITGQYTNAYVNSITLSVITAVVGGAIGLVVAWALTGPIAGPRIFRSIANTFTTVSSQSGGVPLAFCFVATLGAQGLITKAIFNATGYDLSGDFKIESFNGLILVYLYFQVPLMAILMAPAMEGLRKEWSEAAESLGASRLQYLRDVATPILMPAIAGSMLLLFANSFAAYATAQALTAGTANLVPINMGLFLSGNVIVDTSFGAAFATWMILVVAVCLGLRLVLMRRSARWLR